MLLKSFLNLDIIYLTWESGLINSFSSWKMISRWALFYHGGRHLGWLHRLKLKTFLFLLEKLIKTSPENIELLIFKYINCIFKILFFSLSSFFSNEKISKSEIFKSHDKLFLHIKICKQNSYGGTPQLCNCQPASWFCKQWWGWGSGGLRAGLKFYNNIFLIIMVKLQEKVC